MVVGSLVREEDDVQTVAGQPAIASSEHERRRGRRIGRECGLCARLGGLGLSGRGRGSRFSLRSSTHSGEVEQDDPAGVCYPVGKAMAGVRRSRDRRSR